MKKTKIIILAAVNANSYTQKVNHQPMNYTDDAPPLLCREESLKVLPLQEDAYYAMDMHTYHHMKQHVPTDKIILWGLSAEEHQKHYSDNPCFAACTSIHDLLGFEKNVYCVGIKQNFLRLFLQHADEMTIIRFLDNNEEWNKEESLPTFPEPDLAQVWDLQPLNVHENYLVEQSIRRDSWREMVANTKVLFAQLFTTPEKLSEKRLDVLQCMTRMRTSCFSDYSIIQHLLGERFSGVYKSFENAIPDEYLEYAPSPTPKLSGESQRQMIFISIFVEWFNKAFCEKSMPHNEFKEITERIYEKQHPKDILHGDYSKDLYSYEIERVVEQVFIALGCTPEKAAVAA